MKKIVLKLLTVGTLGLLSAGAAHAATCVNAPCIAPSGGSVTGKTITTISASATDGGNPSNSVIYFEASTGGASNTQDNLNGTVVIAGVNLFTSGGSVAGPIQPTVGGTFYNVFAKACPSGAPATDANCSSWVSLGSITTDAYPANPGFQDVLKGDTAPRQFTERASGVSDANFVLDWQYQINNNDSTLGAGSSSVNTLQPSGISAGGSGNFTANSSFYSSLLPNRGYTLTEDLIYYYNKIGPSYTTPTFFTQPATPVAGSVSGITHCSATFSFQNTAANPANPADTQYKVSGGGTSGSVAIGGTGIFSDGNSVTLNGLPDGQTINANVEAENRGGGAWLPSVQSNYAPFNTVAFNATGVIANITPTAAQYTVTISNTVGLISYQVFLNGSAYASVQSFASSPIVIQLTGLTPGTNYTAQIVLTENSCSSAKTANATFTTPAGLGGSIATVDHGTNVDLTASGAGGNPPYTFTNWSVTGPAGTSFSNANGATTNMTYATGGTYLISVTITDNIGATATISKSFSTNQSATKIAIEPSAQSVVNGQQTASDFHAYVCDQLETGTCSSSSAHLIPNQAVAWTVNGGGTLTSANGVTTRFNATAISGGTPWILTASFSGASATASITVLQSGPVVESSSFVLSPDSKALTATVTAHNLDTHSVSHTWSASDASITFSPTTQTTADVGNNGTPMTTQVTFGKAGTFTLTDNLGFGVTVSSTIVVPQVLTKIKVCANGDSTCAATITLRTLQTQQFTATGIDQFGNTMSLGSVSWSNNVSASGASASFSSPTLGQNIQVTATSGGFHGSLTINLISFDVSSAYAYPVPYKANTGTGFIHFRGLGSQSTLHIYTTSGRRVLDLSLTSDAYEWNIKNSSGESVASGVYFYVIESPEGKKNGKLIIIQ